MTHYWVLAVTPTNEDWLPDYTDSANALAAKHGGRYFVRTSSHERLEGEREDAASRIILEWTANLAAETFVTDLFYASHLKARIGGSISHHFHIEGKDDLA